MRLFDWFSNTVFVSFKMLMKMKAKMCCCAAAGKHIMGKMHFWAKDENGWKCITFVGCCFQGSASSCQSTWSPNSTKRLSSHIRFRQRPKSNFVQEQRPTKTRFSVRKPSGFHQSGQLKGRPFPIQTGHGHQFLRNVLHCQGRRKENWIVGAWT